MKNIKLSWPKTSFPGCNNDDAYYSLRVDDISTTGNKKEPDFELLYEYSRCDNTICNYQTPRYQSTSQIWGKTFNVWLHPLDQLLARQDISCGLMIKSIPGILILRI